MTSAAPSNVNKMSSYTRFVPRIYHDWENVEINEFNFLLTKEIQRNFACAILPLVTVTSAINTRRTDQFFEYKVCDNRTSKKNMACVGASAHTIPGQAYVAHRN